MCLGICPYQSILSRVEQQGTPQPGPHSPSFFSSSPCGTKSPGNLQVFGAKKKWPLPMWSSRFSGKDMDEYLSEARNACHANELKFITYKTARQRSMNTCAGPATPVEKQVVFVFVYQIDWLIMVDIPMIFGLTILTVTTSFLMIYIPIFQTCKNNYITPNLCGQYVQMLHPRSPKQRLTSFPAATETLDPASGFSVSSAFSSGSFSST